MKQNTNIIRLVASRNWAKAEQTPRLVAVLCSAGADAAAGYKHNQEIAGRKWSEAACVHSVPAALTRSVHLVGGRIRLFSVLYGRQPPVIQAGNEVQTCDLVPDTSSLSCVVGCRLSGSCRLLQRCDGSATTRSNKRLRRVAAPRRAPVALSPPAPPPVRARPRPPRPRPRRQRVRGGRRECPNRAPADTPQGFYTTILQHAKSDKFPEVRVRRWRCDLRHCGEAAAANLRLLRYYLSISSNYGG
ncbi:hypothetical protein MSG28_002571 [Choristoneura fumiferana]|uniref:Uncharacterized protein n=1 Tax=Choristoneura fumiferana TaxID=7141 RepID=A0ACC0JWM0_CHOFU|nr:hypothetical protein MSG28_002571 [Choristoneura fumiferana]